MNSPKFWFGVVIVIILFTFFLSRAQGEALDEVNLQRSRLGLPPFSRDIELCKRAQGKAEWQAARGIHIWNGHNGHEGPRTRGVIEGTGVATKPNGWISCAMDTLGSYPAGAGVAIGPDGYRYHCLLLRAPSSSREHRQSSTKPILKTHHLTKTSVVGAKPRVPREPSTPHVPIYYEFD